MPLPGDDGGVVGPADTERSPQSYASSSASTALASLSEEGDCGPEQLQKLEYVVTTETKKLQSEIEQQREEEQQQSLEVLVAAFQVAADRLKALEAGASDARRLLLRSCERVVDALCSVGYGDEDQQLLWRELLCRRWDDLAASLALEMLLLRAQERCSVDKADPTHTDQTLLVIGSAFAQMPAALKEFCLHQMTELVSTVIDEGPAYQFSTRMVLKVQLLERLVAAHFLDECDDLNATTWINEHCIACFECCDAILQMLSDPPEAKAEDAAGMIRMLDVFLLVLKAGLDYLATRRDDIGTLLKILSPIVIGTLSQLARSATLPNEATSSTISEARCVQTSLHVLTTLTSELGKNEVTIVIKIFERLLTSSLIRLNAVRSTLVSTFFDAVHQLVTQSKVATALQIGDLRDWYEEYLTTRQDCPVKDTNALKATRYVCSSDREFRGEDEALSEDHECTSLLSGMGIGDRPCRSKIDRADVNESLRNKRCVELLQPDAPQWFDDEDSEDEDSELEGIVLPPDESDEDEKESDQDKFAKVDDSNVSQWFGDDDDEEDELADIELPLEGYAEYLKLVPAAPLDGASQDDKDCNPNRVAEAEASSDDGSTSTEFMSWSDRSGSRSRSSSLASLPS